MGRLRVSAVVLVCCVPVSLVSLVSNGQASSFSLLNIDFLGRGGGTHGLVARTGDIDNVVWNPSGLSPIEGCAGFASYMDYLVGLRGGTAGYRGRWDRAGYGVYLSYITSGSLTRTVWEDPTGGLGGTFTHTEFVLGFTQGFAILPNLSLGSGLKIARLDLEDVAASGAFADLGATFRIRTGRSPAGSGTSIQATFVARNLTLTSWGEEQGEAPLNAEVGAAVQAPGERLTAGLSFQMGRAGRREIRTGLSALLTDEFEVRMGYRRRLGRMGDGAADLPWQRGLMGGFGIGFGRVWIDYTFEDASPLDGIHRFTLRASLASHDSD